MGRLKISLAPVVGPNARFALRLKAMEYAKANPADPFAFARAYKNLLLGLPEEGC